MKKLLSISLICIICLGFAVRVYAENDFQEAISDLQKEHQEIESHLIEANEELELVQKELSDNLMQIRKLDDKILESETELQCLEDKIKGLRESIDEVEINLRRETKTYEKQRKVFEDRMIAIYESGETQYLDIILNSRDISEFVSTYYVMSEIAQCDSDLLTSIGKRKDEIALAKEKLDREKEQLAALALNQTRTSKVLQNTKTLRENFISKLSEQEQETQAEIDKYNSLFEIINAQILALAENSVDTKYIGGILEWPVPGYTRITSPFAMREHPITGVYKQHTGVDIAAPTGANFVAANDGMVVKAEFNGAYGNMVIVDHGGGISTLYAHGNEMLVKVGQTVSKLQPVLKVGSTGYSTGPHAHFEVRVAGVPVDPLLYITTGLLPNNN